jgi:hypothetical protein
LIKTLENALRYKNAQDKPKPFSRPQGTGGDQYLWRLEENLALF